jgi:hypothetical protein
VLHYGEREIFKTSNGAEVAVKLENDTVWLDAHTIASIFGVNRPAIVKHIGNIYKVGELEEKATCSKMEQVASDGKRRVIIMFIFAMQKTYYCTYR